MSLTPDLPGYDQDSSVLRLREKDPYCQPAEADLAVSQDILHKRIGLGELQNLLETSNDNSFSGDSLSCWVYRLGGGKAVIESLTTLPPQNQARQLLTHIFEEMIGDREVRRGLVETDINLDVLQPILRGALDREDEEIIGIFERRIDEIKPEESDTWNSSIYGWFLHDLENYKLKKAARLPEGYEVKSSAPFELNPKFVELEDRLEKGEIKQEEFDRLMFVLVKTSSNDQLRALVVRAVRHKDMNLLQTLLNQSGYGGNLLVDQLRFNLGQIRIISVGIDLLEKELMPKSQPRPVYEIDDVDEAAKEFDREASRYHQTEGEVEGISYKSGSVVAMGDRAFWLTMKLGELGALDKLKQITDDPYARIEVKKEAIRQLLIAGQIQFLRGYELKNATPVKFWEYKSKLDRSPSNPLSDEQLDKDSEILRRIENDLPSFVAAILEPD